MSAVRQNIKKKKYAENEMLAYQQKESTALVASIMENTKLFKQQHVSEIMHQILSHAQTPGQYFTYDQIKEMTRKVSAEVDLVHQQTQNQRYGSSHIGATAKDISNVVTDVFFFQAEDGIRDLTVTGVQTCALPICKDGRPHEQQRHQQGQPSSGGTTTIFSFGESSLRTVQDRC